MISNRIYLPIETTKRELLSRMSFAITGAMKGWEPIFGSKSDFLTKIKYLKSGHYLGKSIQPGNYKNYKYIKSFGNIISIFDEEGLFSFDEQFSNRRVGEKNFELIENYFLWGEENKKELLIRFKSIENKLILAGNQRIELLKKPLINFFLDEGVKIKQKMGNFILVTTKFPKANFIKRHDLQDFVEHQTQKGWLYNDHLVDCAKNALEHEQQNLSRLIEYLIEFSKQNEEEMIVVRPHPNENYSTYENAFKKFKNIKIIKDHDNTNNWIAACKFLIHFNCTTGLEALLLNKRGFNFMPFKNEKVEYKLLKDVSEVIRTKYELININKNFENKIPNYQEKLKKLEQYIYNIGDINFSNTVLDHLKGQTNFGNNLDKFTGPFFTNLLKLRLTVNKLFKDKNVSSFEKKSLQKLKPFNKNEIFGIYQNLLKKFDIPDSKLDFKEILPRMYLIKQK